jgi:predicted nucleotidyltransferase
MTATLLDFSQQRDLGLHAEVVADVDAAAEPLGIAPLIVGAFARDLQLFYRHGIETQRQTEDLDVALAVPDWLAFDSLQRKLIESGRFSVSPIAPHRLRHRNDLPIDLVPFGGVETRERKIAWPPRGEVVMDLFGFREALASACEVVLPGGGRARVVSLPALALLKIVCWRDRHYQSPRKDAHDLLLIVKHYLRAGNEARLYDEFVEWTQEEGFDYELAGSRMLGHDMWALLDDEGIEKIGVLLSEQASTQQPARLPAEMIPADPDRARALLDAMLGGMMESWRKWAPLHLRPVKTPKARRDLRVRAHAQRCWLRGATRKNFVDVYRPLADSAPSPVPCAAAKFGGLLVRELSERLSDADYFLKTGEIFVHARGGNELSQAAYRAIRSLKTSGCVADRSFFSAGSASRSKSFAMPLRGSRYSFHLPTRTAE